MTTNKLFIIKLISLTLTFLGLFLLLLEKNLTNGLLAIIAGEVIDIPKHGQ